MPSATNHWSTNNFARCATRAVGKDGRDDLSFHRPALTPIYAGVYNAYESITVSQCRCRQNLFYAEWDSNFHWRHHHSHCLLVFRFMLGNFRKTFLRTGEGHNYYFSKAAHANRHYLPTLLQRIRWTTEAHKTVYISHPPLGWSDGDGVWVGGINRGEEKSWERLNNKDKLNVVMGMSQ